jgi:hypothetical protein
MLLWTQLPKLLWLISGYELLKRSIERLLWMFYTLRYHLCWKFCLHFAQLLWINSILVLCQLWKASPPTALILLHLFTGSRALQKKKKTKLNNFFRKISTGFDTCSCPDVFDTLSDICAPSTALISVLFIQLHMFTGSRALFSLRLDW